MSGKLFSVIIAAVMATSIGAAGAGDAANTLYVFTWRNYFGPEAVRRFEERYDCRVEFDYYESNDMISGMLRSGGGYDIITPAPTVAAQLREEGLILDLDHSLLPNIEFVERSPYGLVEDAEMRYSVPYTLSVTGVGYNKKLASADAIGSWSIFSRKGRPMAMLNDAREIIGAGLKFLGHSINSTDPREVAAAGRVVKGWKRNIRAFDVEAAKAALRDGSMSAIQAYNGDIAMLIAENPDIGFFVPREGSALNSDGFVIGADCRQIELAHAFINHFLDPDVAAVNMEAIHYLMPNPEAMKKMSDGIRNNPALNIPEEALAKCEPILGVGDAIDMYDQVFLDIVIGD